jgi:glyoxylase-like metal-dependent hydrolase (beta-lactamase superfamily II)
VTFSELPGLPGLPGLAGSAPPEPGLERTIGPPLRIERVRTTGTFSLDGQDFEVENNIWLIGDDTRVLVVDAAHQVEPIVDAIGDRRLLMIICTHGHNDHINAAVPLADAFDGAPIALHPDDQMLWDAVYPDRFPTYALEDGGRIDFASNHLHVLHTPGHSPGGVSLLLERPGVLFSGDTLFRGGPGATGRSYSDFPTIISSIQSQLLNLPPSTLVHPGHGDDTTIGEEAPHLQEWLDRGH